MTYKDQLLDPRWQKKRLEILERDDFKCTLCGDTKTTLHIHHEQYADLAWEVDNKYLHTRCAHCHLVEEYYKDLRGGVPFDKITKISKREAVDPYIVLYVYRVNYNDIPLLDIFTIDKSVPFGRLELKTIFGEKDIDSFFDFIHSIKSVNA